jgi:hypothetical protein
LQQEENFAANPLPFARRRERTRIGSQIEKLGGNFGFRLKPRAQQFQMMVEPSASEQRPVYK